MKDYAPFNQADFNKWLNDKGDVTLRLDYNLNEDSVVFDLGGYKGEWAEKIFQKYKCNVYVFEPVQDFYNGIVNKFKDNSKIRVYKYGLGPKNETLNIALTKDSSSTFNTEGSKETIELKSLANFIKNENISFIDLMKINIEGGEYDVLENVIDNNLQLRLRDIQVQFHRFIPDCVGRRNKIRENFAKTHYETYNYEFIWENWRLK